MLRTAKLRHGDTGRLTGPYTTPSHGHHGPHHPFPHNEDPWPAAVRECLHQCADEHLCYCCREQGATDHPGWRDALVYLFHTTGTRDPHLRLVHPTGAKQDAHTGPQVTSDGLHLHVGCYRRQGSLSPPTQGAALLWRDVADPAPVSRSVSPMDRGRPERLDVCHSIQYR